MLMFAAAHADQRGVVAASTLTEQQYLLVAAVAEREEWTDLAAPPAAGSCARTLAEHEAVARYVAALPGGRPPHRGIDPRIVRAAVLVACLAALGACWWVSPGRTAVGLIAAGAFALWSLRRRRAREAAGVAPRPRRFALPRPR
ncbi:MAG: hypothetical protein KDC33_07370 [Thermoleophilia bacterium]|nr:hypothetical protein [Thermoleophilia bacterium]